MNALSQYLESTGETQQHFAARVGVGQSIISKIANPHTGVRPGLALAVKIERATGGKVRPRDWVTPAPEAAK